MSMYILENFIMSLHIDTYNSNYREMIDNGKDKLEWERKVDSSAVNSIKYFISGCLNLTLL